MVFEDRRQAGRELAARLARLSAERPIVLALPRGGVPVAVEVARVLGAPLELLTVRKLGAPRNPELAVGALAEDGTVVINPATARRVGLTEARLEKIVDREAAELRRRVERFRAHRAPVEVKDRTVILVDDGFATGLSDLAAVRCLRRRSPRWLVVAAPVGSREAIAELEEEADEVVSVLVPRELRGVGQWYEDFSPVSDEQVLGLLAEAGVGLDRRPGTLPDAS
jgi:predicted phosphoribosyltransferase